MTEAPEPAPLPANGDGPVFAAPWQARAFGVAMALYREEEIYDWPAFQERLIEEVAAADPAGPGEIDAAYYEQWLAALEGLLVEEGYLDPEEIDDRAAEFADGDRTAEEFVEGVREH